MNVHIEDDIGLDGYTKDDIAGDLFYRIGEYLEWRKQANWLKGINGEKIGVKVIIKIKEKNK